MTIRLIPSDETILAGISAGKTLNQIAEETNAPAHLIRSHVNRKGWEYTKTGIRGIGKDVVWPDDQKIIDMLEAGVTTAQMAKQFGCSRDTVSRRIRTRGLRDQIRSKREREKAPPVILIDDETRITVFKRSYTLDGKERMFRIPLPRVSILSGWEGSVI